MEKISIVIVEDHKLFRHLWAKIFEGHPRIEITGESETVAEAIEMIREKRPDIVFLDINLGQESGFDAVPPIRKISPGTRIIALSKHTEPMYAKKMLRLGARAYITKNSPLEEILAAIEKVMKGELFVCKEIKDILSEQFMNKEASLSRPELSFREIEILKLMKTALSSKEISSALNIGTRTVEVHRRNILKKLKLKNTTSLINYINASDIF